MGQTIESLRAQLEAEYERYLAISRESEATRREMDKMASEIETAAKANGNAAVLRELAAINREAVQASSGVADTLNDLTEHLEQAEFFKQTQPSKEERAVQAALEALCRAKALCEQREVRERTAVVRLNELMEQLRAKA